jgi:hypothetical protein
VARVALGVIIPTADAAKARSWSLEHTRVAFWFLGPLQSFGVNFGLLFGVSGCWPDERRVVRLVDHAAKVRWRATLAVRGEYGIIVSFGRGQLERSFWPDERRMVGLVDHAAESSWRATLASCDGLVVNGRSV